MKVYSVGPDPLSSYELENLAKSDYFVYSYEVGDYCGSGDGLAKRDGKFYHYDFGHCSCYGPIDGTNVEGALYDLFSEDVQLTKVSQKVIDKVVELENGILV